MTDTLHQWADALETQFQAADLEGRLAAVARAATGRVVFTTSLGLEDQVITHVLFSEGHAFDVVTLDTGRLFPGTYTLWAETEQRYGRKILPLYPQTEPLEQLVAAQGINGFYNSIDARKACCHVRKVEPLSRALHNAQFWITGLRADQSAHRSSLRFVEVDEARNLIKVNPLLDWTRERAVEFVNAQNIPINALHAQGFLSIGCAPCTRAVLPGEPERAGRWWWEDEAKKECGLHIGPDGKLQRVMTAASEPEIFEGTR